jgi:hypothetical protein
MHTSVTIGELLGDSVYNGDLQPAKSELRESLEMAVEDDGKK